MLLTFGSKIPSLLITKSEKITGRETMYGVNFTLSSQATEDTGKKECPSVLQVIDDKLTKLGFKKITDDFYVISEKDSGGMSFLFDVVDGLGSFQSFIDCVKKFTVFKVDDFTDLTDRFTAN